jgi:hypothetical protein
MCHLKNNQFFDSAPGVFLVGSGVLIYRVELKAKRPPARYPANTPAGEKSGAATWIQPGTGFRGSPGQRGEKWVLLSSFVWVA